MPKFIPNPKYLRMVAWALLALGCLFGLEWVLLGHSLFGSVPALEKLSFYTATLTALSASFILADSDSKIQLYTPIIGLAFCAVLSIPEIQDSVNLGSASPGTLYCFSILFASALISINKAFKVPKTFFFLMFASVQAVGVIGIAQYLLGIEDLGQQGFFENLAPSTSLIILLMAPLMFVQGNFRVLDRKQRYNLAHQNMALALFLLPIGLSLLSALPTLIEKINEGPDLVPILLGSASLLSCWFLYSFGDYAGEKEAEVSEKLEKQAYELERLYAQQILDAEEKAEEQTRFSSLLAHEIRTPLSTVLGLVEVLKISKSEQLKSVDCWDNLQQIESSAKLLREMINSVLDYAKLKAGRLSVQKNACVLEAFLQELTSIYAPVAARKRIRLVHSQPDFEPRSVMIDEIRVREILSNLIDNALKFTEEEGCISINVKKAEIHGIQKLVFEIKDDGVGIEQVQLERIFQPFRQASEGISRRYGGTGLGLSYSRELAEFMGGTLCVESEYGIGSIFKLQLPFVATPSEAAGQSTEGEPSNHVQIDGHSKDVVIRALMVEDHPLNATIHSTLLKEIGIECDWVDSGEKALSKVERADQYDVILMDINLGSGLNGLETTLKLREKFGQKLPPVLALTAGTLDTEIEKISNSGIKGIIPKPFDLVVAKEAIQNATMSQELS